MTRPIRTALMIAPAALLFVAASAIAQDPPPPRGGPSHAAVKANAEARTEAMKAKAGEKKAEAAEKKAEGTAKADEAKAEAKAEAKEEKAELKEAWKKLKDTRKERRKERIDEIKKLWGELPKQPAVKNELRVHAWRMARLQRMKAVAQSEGKDKLVEKIDELIGKEQARHKKKMEHFKEKGGAQ